MGNSFKTYFLMVMLIAIITGFGYLCDAYFNGQGMFLMIFFLFSLLTTWVTYWFADSIVLKMYRGQIVTANEEPMLHEIVSELAMRARLPMPKIAIVPMEEPNAFATGRNPKHALVACTRGILKTLNREELKGVLGHEMGHIKNRDTLLQTVAATLTGVIGMLASTARWGTIFRSDRNSNNNPLLFIVIIIGSILLPLVSALIQLSISRSREYLADSAGAEFAGDPMSLANALLKIENTVKYSHEQTGQAEAIKGTEAMFIINPFSGLNVSEFFNTHPPTEKRVERLRQMSMGRKVN